MLKTNIKFIVSKGKFSKVSGEEAGTTRLMAVNFALHLNTLSQTGYSVKLTCIDAVASEINVPNLSNRLRQA